MHCSRLSWLFVPLLFLDGESSPAIRTHMFARNIGRLQNTRLFTEGTSLKWATNAKSLPNFSAKNSRQQMRRLRVAAGLDNEGKEKALELAKKMRKAGWDWPITEVFSSYDWDEIRQDLDMSPIDAFSMVISVKTYIVAAIYMAATYGALQIINGLPDESVWSAIAAACAGYFGIGVVRQLFSLRAQYELNKQILELEKADDILREALQQVTKSELDEMEEIAEKASGVEWDPEGLLPPSSSEPGINVEPEEGGLIAGMEKRRAEAAVKAFREKLVTAVRDDLDKSKAQPQGSAFGTLSSLDSLVSSFGGGQENALTAESLGVSEDLFEAAERMYRKYDDMENGVLSSEQLQEMARRMGTPLPGERETSIFIKKLGAETDGRLSKDAFLRFWAQAEMEKTGAETAISAEVEEETAY